MIQFLRNNRFTKSVAIFIAFSFLFQIFFPLKTLALTGGPSQPEVQSFEPVGTSEMVDLFTGNFTYNIPLMEVDGYPINISYHAGIAMDQEASWVGLGWNINPGVINRNMRGIPDDFNGDVIQKEMNLKKNWTLGGSVGIGGELFGFDGLSTHFSYGLNYNNYVGVGIDFSANITTSLARFMGGKLCGGLGISSSSSQGLTLSPVISLQSQLAQKESSNSSLVGSLSCGLNYNSRQGLRGLSFGANISESKLLQEKREKKGEKYIFSLYRNAGGLGIGSSISYLPNTYIPKIQMPMKNYAVDLSVKFGPTIFSADITADVVGYYSEQSLATNNQEIKAYGYLYSHNGTSRNDVLLDFNREKDAPFTLNTPALPVTNFTYDIYSISGQGVSGMYRPYRSDFGYVYDNEQNNISYGGSLGIEIGAGNLFKIGGDIKVSKVESKTTKWQNNNKMLEELGFSGGLTGSDQDNLFEPFYFKQVGDKIVDPENSYLDDNDLFDRIGGSTPVRAELQSVGGFEVQAKNVWQPINEEYYTQKRGQRVPRNQLISYTLKKDYQSQALQGTLYDDIYYGTNGEIGEDYHIGEISVVKPDGVRYIYGIPAYNTSQQEVAFNVSGQQYDCTTGLVNYISNGENKQNDEGNTSGIDGFFSKTTLPPYAHSYLLTAVLSPDYVDVENDGPTENDLGSFTLFEYEKVTDYQWRIPYEEEMANFDERMKTIAGANKGDDQGNYIYGTKDLWFLKFIKTKNYVAEFVLSDDRNDCLGVKDEDGGLDESTPVQLLKLDKIVLYSRFDYKLNPSNATPIKTVHFDYNYELCPGIPNNIDFDLLNPPDGNGKLTLTKIFFTYGNSNKARFSPYEFHYSEVNPEYDIKAYDRWGSYKPVPENAGCTYDSDLNNSEYPYVNQDKLITDDYASAWSLKTIHLPSGGKIEVEYESDDYAYVQDKRAMQMVPFYYAEGSGDDIEQSLSQNNLEIQLKLPIAVYSVTEFKEKYLEGIDKIYFRTHVKVNKSNNNRGFEYVSGYAELADNGISFPSGVNPPYYNVLLKLEDLAFAWADLNPISYAAINFGRTHTPNEIYKADNGSITKDNILDKFDSFLLGGMAKNILEALMGQEQYLYSQGIGGTINLKRSWVRLTCPTSFKLGGGSRVKKISLSDSWSEMTSANNDAIYGQQFDYTTEDENGEIISSGVACYEPLVGGDENPFKLPVYKPNNDITAPFLGPDDRSYLEEPFGESFFPSPSVGYSKVTVTSLQHPEINRHATGKTVSEFYTSKDYPTITKRTDLQLLQKKTSPLVQLFTFRHKDYLAASQGYVIELNDMHGKPKSNLIYAENQVTPLSGIRYYYKDNGVDQNNEQGKPVRKPGDKLVNVFKVIDKKGIAWDEVVGLDYDFINDVRQQKTDAWNVGVQVNMYGFLAVFFPIIAASFLPSYSEQNTKFQSIVTTKVIQRYGILDETVSFNLGENSRVTQKVMALDKETGEVLLTETTNEYNDRLYQFSYPAHWVYDGMGQAYKNVGLTRNVNINNDEIVITGELINSDILVNGNEIVLYDGDLVITPAGDSKFWIWETFDLIGDKHYYVLKKDGFAELESGGYDIKVIRSGRRNLHNTQIGTFSSRNNPLDFNIQGLDQTIQILDASATEYSDKWRTYCCREGINLNPFVSGIEGNWRFKKSYYYLTYRTQPTSTSSLRDEGYYLNFESFWNYNQSIWEPNVDNKDWSWDTEVTNYSPYGYELENKDRLNRYSSAIYRYNFLIPVAIGQNTMYRELAYDGFEDYDWINCWPSHFDFKDALEIENIDRTSVESHTGNYSLEVGGGQTATVTRNLNGCN